MSALEIPEDEISLEEIQEALPVSNKPIVSAEIEAQALDAISQFLNRETWQKWGMHNVREQGSCVCISGPSGTGKTTLAKWMGKKVKKGFLKLSSGEVGGGNPGDCERMITAFFDNARKRKNATIFIDECDNMLIDRESISSEGKTWQLGMIEMLMMQMNTYPGLILCATNHIQNLDPALADRFIAIIHLGNPEFAERIRLWKTKIPKAFPFQPTDVQLKELAKAKLTGRTIENVIVSTASHCIRQGIKPTMQVFHTYIDQELSKRIEK